MFLLARGIETGGVDTVTEACDFVDEYFENLPNVRANMHTVAGHGARTHEGVTFLPEMSHSPPILWPRALQVRHKRLHPLS